jgi:hypothetical protein
MNADASSPRPRRACTDLAGEIMCAFGAQQSSQGITHSVDGKFGESAFIPSDLRLSAVALTLPQAISIA